MTTKITTIKKTFHVILKIPTTVVTMIAKTVRAKIMNPIIKNVSINSERIITLMTITEIITEILSRLIIIIHIIVMSKLKFSMMYDVKMIKIKEVMSKTVRAKILEIMKEEMLLFKTRKIISLIKENNCVKEIEIIDLI